MKENSGFGTSCAGSSPVSCSPAAPMANRNASMSTLEPKHLSIWEEAVGQLTDLHDEDGYGIAVFSWGSIYLPNEVLGTMRGLVGSRIGILRDDRSRYLFRVLVLTPPRVHPTDAATTSAKLVRA